MTELYGKEREMFDTPGVLHVTVVTSQTSDIQ